MKLCAHPAVACALLLTAVPSFAVAPPQEIWFPVDRLHGADALEANAFVAAAAASSEVTFASALTPKLPVPHVSIEGWATGGPYQRAPVGMWQGASERPSLIDMTAPIASGGSINIEGPRVSPIPEPSTYALLVAGLAAVGFIVRKRSGR